MTPSTPPTEAELRILDGLAMTPAQPPSAHSRAFLRRLLAHYRELVATLTPAPSPAVDAKLIEVLEGLAHPGLTLVHCPKCDPEDYNNPAPEHCDECPREAARKVLEILAVAPVAHETPTRHLVVNPAHDVNVQFYCGAPFDASRATLDPGLTTCLECFRRVLQIAEPVAHQPPTPPPGSWQHIETAPKDGTRILATMFRFGVRYYGCLRWESFDDGSAGWIGGSFMSEPDGNWTAFFQPEMWTRMPALPAPPIPAATPAPVGADTPAGETQERS